MFSRRRLVQFQSNLGRASELVGLGEAVEGMTAGRLDATDMYRFALVQVVAAVDTYMHGVILDCSLEILAGKRSGGMPGRLGLPMSAVADLVAAPDEVSRDIAARTHMSALLGKETFQRPDSIAQALASVGVEKIWSRAFGAEAPQVISALGLIVNRRNQIVHACDIDTVQPSDLLPLEPDDVRGAIQNVGRIVNAIQSLI